MTDKRLNKTCHSAKTKFVPRGNLRNNYHPSTLAVELSRQRIQSRMTGLPQ